MPWNLSGSGRRLLVSRRSVDTLTDSSPVLVLKTVPAGSDDVAEVPVLECRVGLLAHPVARDVELDATGGVLQRCKAGLAHDALEHHAAGHAGGGCLRLQRFGIALAVGGQQRGGAVGRLEIVRKCGAAAFGLRLAQLFELLAPLGNQLVVVWRGRVI